MSLVHHNWQNPIYFIDGVRLWADDNGVLRYKQGVPTSHTDGTPLLLADGSIAMTSDLDMGGFSITNVNLVDGTDISAHVIDDDAHHDPVTLAGTCDAALALDGQELDLTLPASATIIYPSSDYHDESGDSDLLNAYQALSAEDIIAHEGRLYVKTTDGMETMDGHCILNGSFENLDNSSVPEFWIRKA